MSLLWNVKRDIQNNINSIREDVGSDLRRTLFILLFALFALWGLFTADIHPTLRGAAAVITAILLMRGMPHDLWSMPLIDSILGTVVPILTFLLLIILFAIMSPVYIRWMFRFYHKLETYHDPSEEGLSVKIYKLWLYNTLISVFAAGVTVIYAPFVGSMNVPITLETVAASAILIAVVNFGIRLASYSYMEGVPDELPVKRLREDAHNVGYAFMVSIWFLLFIGLGLSTANGSIVWSYDLQALSPPIGLVYAIIVLTTPAVLAIISEWWLNSHASVPTILVDEYK